MIMLDIYMLLTGGLEVDVSYIISLYFLYFMPFVRRNSDKRFFYWHVAQMVERPTVNRFVVGSSPTLSAMFVAEQALGTNKNKNKIKIERNNRYENSI